MPTRHFQAIMKDPEYPLKDDRLIIDVVKKGEDLFLVSLSILYTGLLRERLGVFAYVARLSPLERGQSPAVLLSSSSTPAAEYNCRSTERILWLG